MNLGEKRTMLDFEPLDQQPAPVEPVVEATAVVDEPDEAPVPARTALTGSAFTGVALARTGR